MKYLRNRLRHVLRRWWVRFKLRGVSTEFSPDLPLPEVRRILQKNGLGFGADGLASWWYEALDFRRNDQDDLTKDVLKYLREKVPKDARVLGTGCGIGWMLFWLAQHGFRRIDGFDVLPNVVQSAKEIAALAKIEARIWEADGFKPQLQESYDLILILYWVYSAWDGNYGNRRRSGEDRERLLSELLGPYAAALNSGGRIVVELIDAVADQRVPASTFYPIRHSREQVARCAAAHGLAIEHTLSNDTHGHLPRMAVVLRKS